MKVRMYPVLGILLAGYFVLGQGLGPGGFAQNDDAAVHAAAGSESAVPGDAAVHGEVHGEDQGDGHGAGHQDPVAPVLLEIFIILLAAKIGADIAERLKQPAVLGELMVGVVIGALTLIPGFEQIMPKVHTLVHNIRTDNSHIDILARIGVIILLFEVGLESTLGQMKKVGASAFLVATVGVIAPFALGYATSSFLITDFSKFPAGVQPFHVHLFIGATLCATSVGITARVFKDMGRIQDRESQIVLGAAVIDDVMGLVILAVVSGIIIQAEGAADGPARSVGYIATVTTIKALVFLVGAVLVGIFVVPHLFRFMAGLHGRGLLLVSSLCFCFAMAYLANAIELATIVGAFAAGLVLEEVHFKPFNKPDAPPEELEELIKPISAILVPIFFVEMGVRVQLETFNDPKVLFLAAALTASAFVGKQVCGLAVLERGSNRLAVGLGMVPRGEVGLIFAGIGRSLGVVDKATFTAVVIMVMVTTMVTPPFLTWAMKRKAAASPADGNIQ